MEIIEALSRMEVWHKEYNLDKKDNLHNVPDGKAVFGIFAIVNEEPVNCRYVGETENLRATVADLFANPPGTGLKKFMQGPWIQMLQYQLLPDSDAAERQKLAADWAEQYQPKFDDTGEYPGYYNY